MTDIKALIEGYQIDEDWQRGFYEWMHANPELSMREDETYAKIVEELERFDCEVVAPIGSHGICAVFENGEGPCVLYRADFDGLPVTETTGVPYASTKQVVNAEGHSVGTMHACGHDIHTTAALSVCDFLNANRDAWAGTFVALFQPGEEIARGAQDMVDNGLTEKVPTPDVVLGQHVMPGRAGDVMTKPGPQFAACDSLRIRIPGRGAHGSMPHNSIDPTFTAAMIIARLQAIVGREVNPADFAVVTVGSVKAGTVHNIIPDYAELQLNTRFYDDRVKARVLASIERVARAEVLASGVDGEAEIEYLAHTELVDNDQAVYDAVRATFDDVFGEASITADAKTVSEDFPVLGQAFGRPYLFWLTGCTPQQLWDDAVAADRVLEDVPVNHMSNFLPEYAPTIRAATNSGIAAALTYLGR